MNKETELMCKELREQIVDQMEFYFSDSNLAKDRFLKQEIVKSSDGFIDLSLFTSFNKIRALTEDLSIIKDALTQSELLELNEEKSKVKRKTQFIELKQQDIDERTIYAENLPSKANHDLIKKWFSQFGKVNYVSLPKFKSTNQIKGFAFVEFDCVEAAENATLKVIDEQSLCNIGKFPKYNKQLLDLKKKVESIASDEHQPKSKKRKTTDKLDSHLMEDEKSNSQKNANQLINLVKTKKEASLSHLKIISKLEWLRLKKEYLQKQKESMAKLKKTMNETTKQEENNAKMHDNTRDDNIRLNSSRGCIVKLVPRDNGEFIDDIFKLNKLKFKTEKLLGYTNDLSYIDMDKNQQIIYLRCKTNEIAMQITKDTNLIHNFDKILLSGREETDYLNRIEVNKISKQAKIEKKLKSKHQMMIKESIQSNDQFERKHSNDVFVSKKEAKHIIFEDD